MSTMTGGDVLVEALAREGFRHVFSMPGGQLLPVYDGIREHPMMDLIAPRHEGASALMACGYAMASGEPAVVMSTVGAGVIYESGGLLLAWRERLPVISIAPQVQSWKMKPIQESLQACDQDEIFRPFTKFRAIVYHYDRIGQLVRRAIKVATAPEPGPVHLDIPVDVLFEFHRVGKSRSARLFPPGVFRFEGQVPANEEALDAAARLVNSSRRPLALVGRGTRHFAGEELMNFLEAASVPVLHSPASFASVKSDYDKRLGDVSLWMEDEAFEAAAGCDLLLIFEADEPVARFAQEVVRRNPQVKVAQSAQLAAGVGSFVPVQVGMVGTIGAVLGELSKRVDAKADRDGEWIGRLVGLKAGLEEEYLSLLGPKPRVEGVLGTIGVVAGLLRPQDWVVCDGRLAAAAALARLKHPGLHRVVMLGDDYIPGAGLPVALGIRAASPDSRVFLVTETDRMKRHSRELQSGTRYGLPVTTFLFQDKAVKPDEEVDFTMLARSFGVRAHAITEPVEEITPDVIEESFSSKAGTLFDASTF